LHIEANPAVILDNPSDLASRVVGANLLEGVEYPLRRL
jgi:hypothetical protein